MMLELLAFIWATRVSIALYLAVRVLCQATPCVDPGGLLVVRSVSLVFRVAWRESQTPPAAH